ncbi:hypothetical protein RUM44_001943 [Polyplax serrata]|uniref:RBD domain-containing protein n=1 Tax=Polyplax serrata TaxID=468196 RepID=A0ABR1ALH3_POLSC
MPSNSKENDRLVLRMSLPVTEDTPPDMLAGAMDLNVVLPNGKTVKMSVQRGTPMMDLLVQVTTAHCLSPGDFSLQAMADKGVLPFKPSTPIGALDMSTVKVVEKKSQNRGRAPQVPQSFLNTFRLQVHLPRSQLFVLRVTPDITLSEIMTHICTEKNLNLEKYEFRNPGTSPQDKLDASQILKEYLGTPRYLSRTAP